MNQKQSTEGDSQTAILIDLPLGSEQAEQTKAGSGVVTIIGPPAKEETKAIQPFGGFNGGVRVAG